MSDKKEQDLQAFAEYATSFHCWNSNTGGCTLTREQGRKLTEIAFNIAKKRGYDNGGTGGLAIHPTQEIPLVSLELWMHQEHTWYTLVLEIDWTKSTARFYNEHEGGRYDGGCLKCKKLLEEYKKADSK